MDSRGFRTLVFVSVACLGVIPSSIISAAGLRDEAVTYREEGYERQRYGDLQSARSAYQKAAAINPSDPILHNYFGLLYQQQGDLEAAKQSWTHALVLDPSYKEALWNLATLHDRLGNREQALFQWLKLGMLYEQDGELPRAQEAYQQVLEIDSNYLEAMTNLAMVEERLGDQPHALLHWLKAGLLLEQRGELGAARGAYVRALMVNPNSIDAQSNLAMLQERMGSRGEAVIHWLKLGSLYEQAGQLDAAKRAYERVLALDPHSLEALSNLAVLWERTGNRDLAIAYWAKCQHYAGPNDPWAARAEERLMALGAIKSGQAYHRYVLQQEMDAYQHSLEEFQAVTDQHRR